MNCFYQLFLKPYPRQGSLTSKIKHFKRDSLPLSIPRQFTPVGTAFTAVLNNLVVVILVLHVLNLVPVHRCF